MSRKEEILRDNEYDVHYYGRGRQNILEAMDEHAKEVAIGFARYIILNFLTIPVSYEDSYNQYIQSLTK